MRTRLTKLFIEFFESEQASGVILILCTVFSIAAANSAYGHEYLELWHTHIGYETQNIFLEHSLELWINDGLMAIFFLLIGLEIERELYIGELSDRKKATLPVIAAIGGMLTPAAFHFLFNHDTPTASGAGITMATDIAFALGAFALLGNRVPASLKVFLTALAIIDDLGAILIIAMFYAGDFSFLYLMLALGVLAFLFVLNRLGVHWLPAYLIPGLFMWYFTLQSGIHAIVAGVMLAFVIPFGNGDKNSPSYKLQHFLHKPVAFIILPLFALANTGVVLNENWVGGLATLNSLGIFAGMLIGKPLGISLFSFLAVKLRFSQLPGSVTWRHIIGTGFLGGIGFTMSIFITLLAFGSPDVIQRSKISVLLGSMIAGTIGLAILNGTRPRAAAK